MYGVVYSYTHTNIFFKIIFSLDDMCIVTWKNLPHTYHTGTLKMLSQTKKYY